MSQRVPFRISTRPTTKLGSRGSALEEGLEEEMEEMEVMEVMEVIEGMAGMENMGERMEEGILTKMPLRSRSGVFELALTYPFMLRTMTFWMPILFMRIHLV
jgi:hypothetical protein